ncbi:MAG: CAP domain-containing protein [Planctomycetes bacterium]|nr:CAP domain-containing protein [Planctomycetota bacterium]
MRFERYSIVSLVLGVLMLLFSAGARAEEPAAPASDVPTVVAVTIHPDELELVQKINAERRAKGLPRLAVRGDLVTLAQQEAVAVARHGPGVKRRFEGLDAKVFRLDPEPRNAIDRGDGLGGKAFALWKETDAKGYEALALNPAQRFAGAGLVRSALDERIYVALVFASDADTAVAADAPVVQPQAPVVGRPDTTPEPKPAQEVAEGPRTAPLPPPPSTAPPLPPPPSPIPEPVARPDEPAKEKDAAAEIRAMAYHLVALMNQERKKAGRKELIVREDLMQVAQAQSEHMAARKQLSHQDAKGRGIGDRFTAAKIDWRGAAENVASTPVREDPADEAHRGWMNSEGHRDNVLNKDLVYTGVGIACAGDGRYYFTQVFLTPQSK